MGDRSTQVDPDLVYDLLWGIFKPQFIRLALQLDVFTPLAAGSATAEQVAQACGCDTRGMECLLDYLCGLKVLDRQGEGYALTPTAAAFLVRGEKAYAGDMVLHYTDEALFDSIQGSLRSGKPSSLGEQFAPDAWLESYLPWRVPKSLEMWEAAGITAGRGTRLRILDVACGCAVKSLALARVAPDVRVTCLDSEEVLVVARDLAERMGVESQVIFKAADLLDADLGESEFEAVLTGQITHYLTEDQNAGLFGRIYSALTPGGVLVIDCPMAAAEPDEAASLLTLVLWANSGGGAHSFQRYRTWLGGCGFGEIEQLSERWVRARRAGGD